MKRINGNIKILYIIVICFFLINLIIVNINPNLKIIETISWVIIFILGLILTRSDYNNYPNEKDKIYTLLIILIIFFITYFSLGLIFSYSYNVYDNSSLNSILNNALIYIIPLMFQEYIRYIFVSYSNNKKLNLYLITLLFIIINFNYVSLFGINSGEMFLKFICLNLLPLIFTEYCMTYLCSIGGYKMSIIYKTLFNVFIIFLPILPKLNFFINGFIMTFLPIIIYSIFNSYHIKESQKVYFEYRRKNYLEYIFIVLILGLFIGNLFGIFKYQMIAIMSDSMNPKYYKGDAAIIVKSNKDLKVGDIVSFKDSSGNTIIHRINNINNGYITTKGDNNNTVDNKKIRVEDVEGKYLFHIKFLGYPRMIISEILGW